MQEGGMSNHETVKIRLPAYDEQGQLKVFESLECYAVDDGALELVHSPGLVEGLAAGDHIVLKDERPCYEILRRSGNLCVWFFMESSVDQEKESAAPPLVKAVEAIGGYLDGGTHRSLIFTVPISAGFERVAAVFDEAVKHYPGSVWLYGNVYDPIDGETPLNWWLPQA